MKTPIQLDLFRLLGDYIEGLGVPKPNIVSRTRTEIRKSVLIGFDSTKLPYQLLSGAPEVPKTFYGVDRDSTESACHKAVMCLAHHLKQSYGVEIKDLSDSKARECEVKCLHIFSAIDTFVQKLNVFLTKYEGCTDDLWSIIAYCSQKHGQCVDDIVTSAEDFLQMSVASRQAVKEKLIALVLEGNGYRAGLRTNSNNLMFQAPAIVWNISQKQVLASICSSVGLTEPNYSSKIIDGDLFVGYCKIHIGDCLGPHNTGRTKFKGSKMCTAFEAECSAAEKALLYLERSRNLEIIDFNYGHMMLQRKKLCEVIQHRKKLDELFCEANATWSTLIKNVEELMTTQYGLSQAHISSDPQGEEWMAKMCFLNELEEALTDMKNLNYVAVSDMATTID